MSFLNILIYFLAVCMHIAIIVFNVGALNAYMQHKKILQSRELKGHHMFLSIIFGIFGILVLPAVIILTRFPGYGLMYYRLSLGEANYDWEEKVQEAETMKFVRDKLKHSTKETGSYIDIWESIWEIKFCKNYTNY